ncbi:response regulator [Amaricoccus sp. W119]|uniref:response regulator n=1 Tax=Amaricoccus sp. W119 TaxID=3391833 RepID=UPI0039A630B8
MSIIVSPFEAERSRPGGVRSQRAELLDRALLAHDLRGGLSDISGGLSAIDPASLPVETREQVERVLAAADAVGSLVHAALGEYREEPDPAAGLDFQGVDVSRLLDHQRRRWTAEARRKGQSLRIVAEADAPTRLDIDPALCGRMLTNLVAHAIGRCEAGGIELVASATREGGILLRVADTGPAVRQDTLERILGLGADDPAMSAGVEGLELMAARRLAARMGARFALRNRSGGGFEALIELGEPWCSRAEPAAPEPEADLAGARILLAEDNPTNQMVATQMLRALRAEVTVTSDGAEAIAAFEAQEFDLVVLDIEMPRVSGLDVIRRIRSRGDARARVPIVALTAYAMRDHQDQIAEAGANALVSKPISGIEQLGRALAPHLPSGVAARRPRAPGAGDPVVDAAIYGALADAIGPDLMNELFEKVFADLSAARAELEAARAPRNTQAIRSASHILISVAGAVGAVRLQSMARSLNALAHENAPLDAALTGCVAEIDAVLAFLARDR